MGLWGFGSGGFDSLVGLGWVWVGLPMFRRGLGWAWGGLETPKSSTTSEFYAVDGAERNASREAPGSD